MAAEATVGWRAPVGLVVMALRFRSSVAYGSRPPSRVLVLGVGLARPATWGRGATLGVSRTESRNLLVPMTIAPAADALATGPISGLQALAAPGRVLRTRTIGAVISLCGAFVGAAWAGAHGAAITFALGSALLCVIWWRQAPKTLRGAPDPALRPKSSSAIHSDRKVGALRRKSYSSLGPTGSQPA